MSGTHVVSCRVVISSLGLRQARARENMRRHSLPMRSSWDGEPIIAQAACALYSVIGPLYPFSSREHNDVCILVRERKSECSKKAAAALWCLGRHTSSHECARRVHVPGVRCIGTSRSRVWENSTSLYGAAAVHPTRILAAATAAANNKELSYMYVRWWWFTIWDAHGIQYICIMHARTHTHVHTDQIPTSICAATNSQVCVRAYR